MISTWVDLSRRSQATQEVMAKVRIPPSHRKPLTLVAAMSPDSFSGLLRSFEPREGDLFTAHIEEEIASVIPGAGEAGAILDALIGACAFGRGKNLTPESASQKIADADVLDLDNLSRSSLADRLASLFQSPVLGLLAHAASLHCEIESTQTTEASNGVVDASSIYQINHNQENSCLVSASGQVQLPDSVLRRWNLNDGDPVKVIDLGFAVMALPLGDECQLLNDLRSHKEHAEFVESLAEDPDLATT